VRHARVIAAASALLVCVVWVLAGCSSLVGPTTDPGPSATLSIDPETGLRWVSLSQLPKQARATVSLIEAEGPFPFGRDGATFGNREGILPRKSGGYYKEYTVPTPGSADRGARRIVTGDADRILFYTGDHYASFRRVRR